MFLKNKKEAMSLDVGLNKMNSRELTILADHLFIGHPNLTKPELVRYIMLRLAVPTITPTHQQK